MPVPYGFGVGDLVATGTLAWNIYKSCKGAPESFGNISAEVLSLHAVLKEAEETLFIRPLSAARQSRLKTILDGCQDVLTNLQDLVSRYHSLGTQAKRTWDRVKWGNEDIAEIRGRLVSNVTLLGTFIATSQVSVEHKLDMFIEEFRQGRMEGSIISTQTVESLSADDKAIWRNIRKELKDIGITVATFEANHDFIFKWFVQAVETGAFEEQIGQCHEHNNATSDESENGEDINPQIKQCNKAQPNAQTTVATDADPARPDITPPDALIPVRTAQLDSANKKRLPDITAIFFGLSLPERRLLNAIRKGETVKAFDILNDGTSSRLLDHMTLDAALLDAARHGDRMLVEGLLESGAALKAIRMGKTVLINAIEGGHSSMVELLIGKGIDINRRSGYGGVNFALRAALEYEPILRILLAAGADTSFMYKHKPWTANIFVSRTYIGARTITILHEAVLEGKKSITRALLEFGANVDACAPIHGTALMIALQERRRSIARLLIEKGANINFCLIPESSQTGFKKDPYCYRTPLEAAVYGGRTLGIKLLFEHGVATNELNALKVAEHLRRSSKRKTTDTGHGRKSYLWPIREVEYPKIMRMLAERDPRHQRYFHQDDEEPVMMKGIKRMLKELE